MIKVMGCFLIIAASTGVGFVLADNFKKRLQQLKELQRAVIQLENEIIYTYTALPEAFMNISRKSGDPIRRIFAGAAEKLTSNKCSSVYEAFVQILENLSGEMNLSREDSGILLDLSKALGTSDMEGHKSVFALAKNDISKKIEEAQGIMTKNTKMYRYLGFSFGAVVAILLI